MSVENEVERHARMKSVGIICTNYTSLHEHMPFLETQVRLVIYDIMTLNSLYEICMLTNQGYYSFF